jgi:signal transduction histidine kinase
MSLRLKFTIFLLIVGLLPLTIMGGHSLVRVESIVRETREQALLSLGKEVGNQIRRLVREGYVGVLQLTENHIVRFGSDRREELQEELTRTQRYHPIIRDLTVVGIEGDIKGSVFFSFRGDWRSTSWYRAVLDGQPLLSEVHAVLYPFHVVMTVAAPVLDAGGNVMDIVFGQLDMDPVMEVLKGVDLGPGGRMLLVDERGMVVASAARNEVLEPFAHSSILSGGQHGPVRFQDEGQEMVGFSFPIEQSGSIGSPRWDLVLFLPVDNAYAALFRMRMGLVLAVLASLVTVLFLSSLFGRHVARRIGSLVDAAKGLGAGRFDFKLGRLGRDEIGELGASLNWASEQLSESRDKLRQYQVGLERQVIERTRELSKANAELVLEIEERKRAEEERRALEEQLRQSQKMEALGTLAGGIAHDFNNLLQAIAGTIQLMLMKPSSDYAQRAHLLELDRVAARATDLVRRLLAFSRKMDSTPRRMRLNDAVRNVFELLQRTIPKSVVIQIELEPGLAEIEADQTQMEQVLINLGGNAVDAMPSGGTLTISTSNLPASDGDAARVRLAVSDTGIGMEQQVVEKIFEPFFTTKPIGKGTGLGLSTVYGIVKGHGGSMSCSSTPGRGATFEIVLPVASEAAEAVGEASPENDVMGGIETVLVVDDEEVIREVVEDVLARNGYSVIQAGDGHQALRLLRGQARVDLVITDLGMPGMDGEKLIREIEKLPHRPGVIISSGYAAHPLLEKEGSNWATLRKPYRLTDLLRKVREVLDSKECGDMHSVPKIDPSPPGEGGASVAKEPSPQAPSPDSAAPMEQPQVR